MEQKKFGPLALVLTLSAVFFILFLAISGIIFMKGGVSKKSSASSSLFSGGSIGVVELNGVIMDSRKILSKLERFEDSDEIKAVVLRLNSPGGAVAPSQEIYQAVKNYKKPLVVSMSSVAASGAFYVACGAKKVFANPGTITGSIGVIMEFANLQKLYEWAKVQRYVIKTGKFKDAGAEYRAMEPEERALLQGMVDNVLGQFKSAVSDGRKLTLDQVTKIADGRIFSGAQAKDLKLVDQLGTFQDAVNDAASMAKLKGKPNLVYSDSHRSKWLEYLMDNGSDDENSESEIAHEGIVSRVFGKLFGVTSPLSFDLHAMTPGIYWLWGGTR